MTCQQGALFSQVKIRGNVLMAKALVWCVPLLLFICFCITTKISTCPRATKLQNLTCPTTKIPWSGKSGIVFPHPWITQVIAAHRRCAISCKTISRDLDLWPGDPKNYRCLRQVMYYLHTKFESCRWKITQVLAAHRKCGQMFYNVIQNH